MATRQIGHQEILDAFEEAADVLRQHKDRVEKIYRVCAAGKLTERQCLEQLAGVAFTASQLVHDRLEAYAIWLTKACADGGIFDP